MERDPSQVPIDPGDFAIMTLALEIQTNTQLAAYVLQSLLDLGVTEFCVCPGSRNHPLFGILNQQKGLTIYYWYEERSAAFFALGRSRRTKRPVAIVTTSGTAVAELLAATMEAYYTSVPLILLTADRPRRYRGSNAPQACEQVGLFTHYAPTEDIASSEYLNLDGWDQRCPIHLNVCFEEPAPLKEEITLQIPKVKSIRWNPPFSHANLEAFLSKINRPLVLVSTLDIAAQEPVAQFLTHLNATVYLEGVSGLREDPRLQHLAIDKPDVKQGAYDGVLRIGGVPTHRVWRDLENLNGQIPALNISEHPFSGLSWANVETVSIATYFEGYQAPRKYQGTDVTRSIPDFETEPTSEPSLIHHLSCLIPKNSFIYLGNSLPIREWDLAATYEPKNFEVQASRGLNGIDGQVSTFLGLCRKETSNWAILGDLTTLYDLAAPWILSQMGDYEINIVVINNGGGKIFARMYPEKEMLHEHHLSFEPLARFWDLDYERWNTIPKTLNPTRHRLIEISSNSF
jgi:2-succinyl-5-enolpyruvyl-6-hydroxy-3-cyclohexene-1-carboxylate synthase